MNECQQGLDNCDLSADCINTEGSFDCQCREGFVGDGRECVVQQPPQVNECVTGEHDCSPFAECIDLEVGFECRCLYGYTGNGRICIGTEKVATGRLNIISNTTWQGKELILAVVLSCSDRCG